MTRLAVIESPFRTTAFLVGGRVVVVEEKRNTAYARALMRHCLTTLDLAPWASHLLYTQPGVLDDGVPEERERGITAGLLWSVLADACVVGVDRGITSGMRDHGLTAARARGQDTTVVRLGGEWSVPPLADLDLAALSELPLVNTSELPSALPRTWGDHMVVRAAAWRVLEQAARATLLVHGSAAIAATLGTGIDPAELVGSMVVEGGVLRPVKVDWACAHPSARANMSGYYGRKASAYVSEQPWSVAHALLWTYAPTNPTPMRSEPCETY